MCADQLRDKAVESNQSKSLGHLLNVATKVFRNTLTEKLEPHGLTSSQWAVLATAASLERSGRTGEANAACIGALLDIDRTTMSGIVQRLTRRGWLEVRTNPHDRRERLISLTGKAIALMPEFDKLRDETVAQASKGLSPKELGFLKELLERVIRNLTA